MHGLVENIGKLVELLHGMESRATQDGGASVGYRRFGFWMFIERGKTHLTI